MKVKLSVAERLSIGIILPRESDFITLKQVRKIQDDIGFTEEEHKLLDFKYAGQKFIDGKGNEQVVAPGNVHWEDAIEEKEFEFGEKAANIIAGALKKLDEAKKLGMQHMALYEKFVLDK